MAFIPTPGCVRTDMMFTISGQEAHNILWFARETEWTQVQREALNTALADWWTTTAKPKFASVMQLERITSVNQDTSSSPSSTLVVSPAVAGTNSSGAMMSNVAACATLRTALRGRNYRGRVYLAGPSANQIASATTWTTAAIADWVTILGTLKTVIEGLGAVWVVVSKYLNKVPRGAGLKTPVTAISMDQYNDSQRRRSGGRGA